MTEPLVDRLPLAAIQMVSATTVQANLDSAHRLILRPENEALDRKEILLSLLDENPVPLV